ncbi:MAG TPA: NAD-dependent epimerase/dehydratase family protein [Gemmatimonadaceae bacterium]|nr:NAD-dependent epimerase/dehydratase family protein [Gemmatimonadaceae bacterium]
MESDALIGSSGFVGSNLLRNREFGTTFSSTNIDEIRGREFRTLICAAPGAEKWKANRDPDGDKASVMRLWESLRAARAEKVILISTVDVYPRPVDVDELTPIDFDAGTPYGRHRLELERLVSEYFNALIIRLPGLFGPGLKKNALYDLLHDHQVDAIDPRAVYQFYDVTRLARDIDIAENAQLSSLNVATEPIAIDVVAHQIFARILALPDDRIAARYDMRTRHAGLFGGKFGYLQSAEDVLQDMKAWVATTMAPPE